MKFRKALGVLGLIATLALVSGCICVSRGHYHHHHGGGSKHCD